MTKPSRPTATHDDHRRPRSRRRSTCRAQRDRVGLRAPRLELGRAAAAVERTPERRAAAEAVDARHRRPRARRGAARARRRLIVRQRRNRRQRARPHAARARLRACRRARVGVARARPDLAVAVGGRELVDHAVDARVGRRSSSRSTRNAKYESSMSSKSIGPSHSSQRHVGGLCGGAPMSRVSTSSTFSWSHLGQKYGSVEALHHAVAGEVVDQVDLRDDRRRALDQHRPWRRSSRASPSQFTQSRTPHELMRSISPRVDDRGARGRSCRRASPSSLSSSMTPASFT